LSGICSAWERLEMRTKFWSENLKGRNHLENLDVDGKIILKRILGKVCEKVWTRCFWLRTWTSGQFL